MLRFATLAFLSLFAANTGLSQVSGKFSIANKALADSLKNKTKWLKVEVIRLEKSFLENSDVTHIADSSVYYMLGFDNSFKKATRYYSADEFVAEYRSRLRNFTISRWPVGLKVVVHKISPQETGWAVGITNPTSSKSTIYLDFNDLIYDPLSIKKLLAIAFADSANWREKIPVRLVEGMSIAEVIRIKGQPKTRADIGEKTILTYDDLKIVFRNEKLVDVQ